MMADETAEVRSLLMRHRLSIVRDLVGTGLLQVLLKGGVLTVAQEEQLNAEDSLEVRCEQLIELIAGGGFEQFKQFCYAIESECSQLISDLINDKLSQVDDGGGEPQRKRYDHHHHGSSACVNREHSQHHSCCDLGVIGETQNH
ncbi:uncharacterized protein LOC125952255 [Anopheles darlingi]|uniref:uncharacterized protein LOC125952255 n=1 Tax=Anopheles darlingi TaxID=43151 RepID=UPI0021002124|nr:uncharacterized protein LOC125952255 [Anopheles darlingi]